jgi:hypothetical protein
MPACSGTTRAGRQCRKKALAGEQFCAQHLGAPMGGRPSVLTDEVQGQIVAIVKGGSLIETAAAVAGVGRSTVYRWLERGAEGEEPYKTFADAIARAKAEGIARNVTFVARAGAKDWRAAAWLLVRQDPDVYGQPPSAAGRPTAGGGNGAPTDQAGL